jgi:alkylation response protein AidB-like acyl-CoA dehydrogenase
VDRIATISDRNHVGRDPRCLDAVQIHGPRGYMVESGLEKQISRCGRHLAYFETTEIQKTILAAYLGL